ncbi:MAG TPA: ADOP family duplicated permease [Thermoanaerobaculia bacterium]|nr:ADOP family duplicated permease [Thermoanaerobaculia bacterium]
MSGLRRDLWLGLRAAVRAPGVSGLVTLTLALGIGATTVMFTLVDGVLLRPLPLPDSDRLMLLREADREGQAAWASYPNFADWRREARHFEAMAAVTPPDTVTVRAPSGPIRASSSSVTGDFFLVGGVAPFRGRWIRPEENRPGAAAVAVVGHRLWASALGAPEDLGQVRVEVAGEVFDVVGVAPPGFSILFDADVWLPLERAVPWTVRGNHVLPVVGRLAAGADAEAADRVLDEIAARVAKEFPAETTAVAVAMEPLKSWMVGGAARPLVLLAAASGLLLLIACVNVGSTLLARGVARRQELGIRASFGASRWQLLRQLLAENAVLAGIGAVPGLALAWASLRLLRRAATPIPRLDQVAVDGRTLLFVVGVSALSVLLFGLLPALSLLRRGARIDLRERVGWSRSGGGRSLVWRLLVGGQVAAALVLVASGGLLVHSLWRIVTTDVGFEPRGVLTVGVDLASGDPTAIVETYARIVDELSRAPGVAAAGVASHLPLAAGQFVGPLRTEGGSEVPLAHYRIADAGYFEALRIPLLRGRLFDRRDAAGAPHAAVINRSLAESAWPGRDPLGQRFRIDGMDPYPDHALTVVGVVEDARHWRSDPGTQLEYYVALAQRPLLGRTLEVAVRGEGEPSAAFASRMSEIVRRVAPDASLSLDWMERRIAATTAGQRFAASVLTALAATAVFLASIGIYGVLAYSVVSRRREMGVRIALGALPGQLARLVLGDSARTLGLGLAVGLLAALLGSRLLRHQLYATTPSEPIVFSAAVVAVALIGLLASWIPAARARSIDAVREMRAD